METPRMIQGQLPNKVLFIARNRIGYAILHSTDKKYSAQNEEIII